MLKIDEVHKDKRGEIHSITGDTGKHEEFVILTCKKGYARGGCVHYKNDEYGVILFGDVEYIVGDNKQICTTGDVVMIPMGTPHYFYAVTDCIVMEFGATTEEKLEKHPETRKIVDEINERN